MHEHGALFVASNIVLIDEVYVFLPLLILRNYKAAFFNTGFDFCKDSINLFPRVVLIVMWIQGSLTPNIIIRQIVVFAKHFVSINTNTDEIHSF